MITGIFSQVGGIPAFWAGFALGPPATAQIAPAEPTSPPLPPPTQDTAASPPGLPREQAPRADPGSTHPHAVVSDGPDPALTPDVIPEPWATQPLVLETQVGLGAPLGLLGVAVDYSPVPVLAVNLGIGLGFAGVQYALMPRLRVIRWGRRSHFAAYVGAGLSLGAYHSSSPSPNIPVVSEDPENPVPHYHWDTAYWTNFEAGIDMRLGRYFSIRPFVGAALLLNPNAGVGVIGQNGEQPERVQWAPYTGVAIGYAPIVGGDPTRRARGSALPCAVPPLGGRGAQGGGRGLHPAQKRAIHVELRTYDMDGLFEELKQKGGHVSSAASP